MPSGLISTSSGAVSANKISAASLGNGSAESPWNERVQSIFSSGAVSSSSGLSASPLLEMLSVVERLGVGAATRDAWVEEDEGKEVVVEEVARGVWLVAPLLLVGVWDRVELYVMARLVMRWEGWEELILVREAWDKAVAFWRVSNARHGRYRSADMMRWWKRGSWRPASCEVTAIWHVT